MLDHGMNGGTVDRESERNEISDYSYVPSVARVAVYDDMRMAPRIFEVEPAPTADYIEHLADVIDEQKRRLGGKIPYSAIREVTENFIHARFTEVVVSIFDGGNTIRFCDQGPGIRNKEKATQPGFTSAIEPMKHYIRGVGSGLPLVKEYLELTHGTITIEDNIDVGAVVTISLNSGNAPSDLAGAPAPPVVPLPGGPRTVPLPPLSEREKLVLQVFAEEGALGVTDLMNLTGLASSSAFALMKKLQEAGLIETTMNKKRILTDYGEEICRRLNM